MHYCYTIVDFPLYISHVHTVNGQKFILDPPTAKLNCVGSQLSSYVCYKNVIIVNYMCMCKCVVLNCCIMITYMYMYDPNIAEIVIFISKNYKQKC